MIISKIKHHWKQTTYGKQARRIFRAITSLRFRNSPPFRVSFGSHETLFATNDLYSYHWFYPRYRSGKLHEESTTMNFIKDAQAAAKIVDIGANIGWFTCLAATVNPQASIVAFEMDSSNAALCRKNIQLNHAQHITLECVAVSNQDGQISYLTDIPNEASSTHRLGESGSVAQIIDCIRLDTYFQGKPCPNLIKIDTEGAEQKVLEGMPELLSRAELTTLYIELHPEWLAGLGGSVREVIAILENSHFDAYCLTHRENTPHEIPIDLNQLTATNAGECMIIARRSQSLG